jgi:hypothetical protein
MCEQLHTRQALFDAEMLRRRLDAEAATAAAAAAKQARIDAAAARKASERAALLAEVGIANAFVTFICCDVHSFCFVFVFLRTLHCARVKLTISKQRHARHHNNDNNNLTINMQHHTKNIKKHR